MTVKITDTSLRDAHQSLFATRMKTGDMVPILETIDKIGFHSLEMWGGATFDSCMRFLYEDPWERLRIIRKHVKNTKLQMLLRGQNIVGYKNYPDDVLEEFIKKTVANGMDIIRIFDAVNDLRNMEKAIEVTKQEGAHAQGTICYTTSPVHSNDVFVDFAKDLANTGCDSICVKDMAGLLSPYDGYDLVKKLKEETDLPVQIHSHSTSGMATTTYIKTIEAGADVVDTTISPFALGTSQPPVEPVDAMLKRTEHNPKLDQEALNEMTEYFKKLRKKYEKYSKLFFTVDTNVLNYQVPGGMISNLTSQLSEANAIDKYDEALEEIPKVRKELGYPPLVTPTSQIVGSQAVLNVLTGERYKMISEEVKNYIAGQYGKAPHEVDPELKDRILKEKEEITGRPADYLESQLEKAREEIEEYIQQEEDVLSYCLFPKVAIEFFKKRRAGEVVDPEENQEPEQETANTTAPQQGTGQQSSTPNQQSGEMTGPKEPKQLRVTVEGQTYDVEVEPVGGGSPGIKSIKPSSKSSGSKPTANNNQGSQVQQSSQPSESSTQSSSTEKPGSTGTTVKAPIAGNVLKVNVSPGDNVNGGEVVMILEAMKMENEITADTGGTVKEVKAAEGASVNSGDPLIIIE